MDIWFRAKNKIIDFIFLIIILFLVIYSKILPGSETNTPSSRDSTS